MSTANDYLNLPNIKKNFISFTFDGKQIEEFGLIVCFSGDRFNTQMSPNFEDETTKIPGRDGQFYWGTTLSPSEIAFNLATDGMTTKQFNAFKAHFKAGKIAKLSLSESPYRYCYARLSNSPSGSFIPFRKEIEVDTGLTSFTTITTEYKGNIGIGFVLDYPIWFNTLSYLDDTSVLTPDQEKAIYEDNIPTYGSMQTMMGVDYLFLSQNNIYSRVSGLVTPNNGVNFTTTSRYAVTNAGDAPAECKITFTLTPTINSTTFYITSPWNEFNSTGKKYNTVTFIDQNGKIFEFQFSLPSIWYDINRAEAIVDSYIPNSNVLDLQAELRDTLGNYVVRAWAMAMVIAIQSNPLYVVNGAVTSDGLAYLKSQLVLVIYSQTNVIYPATFTFNTKTGEAIMQTQYTKMVNQPVYNNVYEESAGDMLKNGYLLINGNYDTDDKTLTYSTMKTDINLSNYKIEFNYAYY